MEAAPGKIIGQLGGRALGASKDDGAPAAGGLQGVGDDGNLVHAVGLEGDLASGGMGEILLAGFGADMDGFFHKPAGERQNCARHRGGKEHGLVGIAIECLEDSLHRGQKAQIQHLVGLIEHQDSHAI